MLLQLVLQFIEINGWVAEDELAQDDLVLRLNHGRSSAAMPVTKRPDHVPVTEGTKDAVDGRHRNAGCLADDPS